MTTPFDPITETIAAALPAVVTEWRPLPDGAAWVLTGAPLGEMILIHDYHKHGEPRPLLCDRHGATRHNWNARRGRYECAQCEERR